MDVESGYGGEYEDDMDSMSVGSLAVTDPGQSSSKKTSETPTKDVDPHSPENLVKRQVARTKVLFVTALVLAAIFLAVAAYMVDTTGNGGLHAAVVGCTMVVLILVFLRYEYLVGRHTSLVLDLANRSKHIVDQLFPSVIRDRLLQDGSRRGSRSGSDKDSDDAINIQDIAKLTKYNTMANQRAEQSPKLAKSGRAPTRVKTFLAGGGMMDSGDRSSDPIAEQFENTTVLFADIAGFTAWSSERDPPQVFKLLETVYGAFDEMAAKLKVFKVRGLLRESRDW